MGKDNCLLSYIIPFYEGTNRIHRCLDSIFAIGLGEEELEVIVVDDCSPVYANEVLAEYRMKHPNLRIIRHNVNKRQGGAKNTGIQNARGKYVAFADQDDEIFPDQLKVVLGRAIEDCPDVVSCRWVARLDGNNFETGILIEDGRKMVGQQFCEQFVDPSVSFGTWSYLFRRQFLADQSRPMAEGVLMEDADWIAWHLFHAESVLCCNHAIYRWNIYSESTSHKVCSSVLISWIKMGVRILDDVTIYCKQSIAFGEKMKENGLGDINRQFDELWKIGDYHVFFQLLRREHLLEVLREKALSDKAAFYVRNPLLGEAGLYFIGPTKKIIDMVSGRFVYVKKHAHRFLRKLRTRSNRLEII